MNIYFKRYASIGSLAERRYIQSLMLGAVHMSRASPANRADSILSHPMVA